MGQELTLLVELFVSATNPVTSPLLTRNNAINNHSGHRYSVRFGGKGSGEHVVIVRFSAANKQRMHIFCSKAGILGQEMLAAQDGGGLCCVWRRSKSPFDPALWRARMKQRELSFLRSCFCYRFVPCREIGG